MAEFRLALAHVDVHAGRHADAQAHLHAARYALHHDATPSGGTVDKCDFCADE